VSAVVLIVAIIGFGAAAMGTRFRIFSGIVVLLILAAGGIVSTSIEAIAANRPTPWMGLLERVSVYGPLLWMAVLALVLLRRK
jgi:hypothetical protein